MSGSPNLVVRTPPRERQMLEELCVRFGMDRSRMVRKLIRDAHERLPGAKVVENLPRPNRLAKQIEERRKGQKRSGLQRPEPPACLTHQWELVEGIQTCSACSARKA